MILASILVLAASLLGGLETQPPAAPSPEAAPASAPAVAPAAAPREVLVEAASAPASAESAQAPVATATELPAADVPRTVRITSERTDYDRREGVLMFDRNVFVDDPEYKLHADQIYVFLDGTNDLKRIVAIGNVAITNELRSGTCAKATYTKATQKIVLYGDGTNQVARLVDEGKRKSEVAGRKITFWVDSEQVEVEGSAVTLDAGTLGGKDGAKKLLGK